MIGENDQFVSRVVEYLVCYTMTSTFMDGVCALKIIWYD